MSSNKIQATFGFCIIGFWYGYEQQGFIQYRIYFNTKMIDDVFHKFTLSEARRNHRTRFDTHTTPSKSSQRPKPSKVSTFTVPCHHRTQSPKPSKQACASKNKLERMIDYLRQSLSLRCSIQEHENSKIRYLCLDDGCGTNFGCAYCFLHSHLGHKKAQIDVCIRDINDLNILINKSYDKITIGKLELRNEMLKEIDLEINNLITDFHSNLQFLKNKAIKEIDNLLLQSSAPLTNLHEAYPIKEEEEDLLTEIIRLDVKGIERDLYQQLQHAEFQKAGALPVIRFFQDMNSTLGHFLAEFKQFFPKLSPLKETERVIIAEKRRKESDHKFEDKYFENVAFESPHFQS